MGGLPFPKHPNAVDLLERIVVSVTDRVPKILVANEVAVADMNTRLPTPDDVLGMIANAMIDEWWYEDLPAPNQASIRGVNTLDYIGMAERGAHPLLLAPMESGYAVMADTQFLPGYCILLASPRVNHLTDLPIDRRTAFLRDMSLIGEALINVSGPNGLRRVNYEILGNADAYLHAHVIPRYQWEPDELIGKPAFNYPPDRWSDRANHFNEAEHGKLRTDLHR